MLALFAALSTAGLVAASRDLAKERDAAQARQFAAKAENYRHTDPALATQLGLAAFATASTMESRSAVIAAAAAPGVTNLNGPLGIRVIGTSSRARLVPSGGESREISIYRAAPGQLSRV